MRIKNKEIRKRRHRKEQTIKAARRELRKLYGDGQKAATAPAVDKAKSKKTVSEKTAEPKKTARKAAPKAGGTDEAPKPRAKRASKKTEEAPAE